LAESAYALFWLHRIHQLMGGVSFRGFQAWIYYPTWTRLDPLVFGVALAAIEKFRPTGGNALSIAHRGFGCPRSH
jgi:hypothetical protein